MVGWSLPHWVITAAVTGKYRLYRVSIVSTLVADDMDTRAYSISTLIEEAMPEPDASGDTMASLAAG